MEAVGKARPVQQSAEERYNEIIRQAGGGGGKNVVTGPDGNPALVKRGASSESSDVFSPALTGIENMTRTEFNAYVPNKAAQLDNQIEAVQRIIDTEKIDSFKTFPGYGGSYNPPIKTQREATLGEIQKAKDRLKQLEKEKQQLQNTAELFLDKDDPSPTESPKG